MKRDDFPDVVKLALAKRVAFICSNPGCGALTVGPNSDPAKATMVGVAAHITAAAPGGPRYNPLLTPNQRKHPDNGVWLCQTCGKRVDDDPVAYPEVMLQQWKKRAEASAWASLGRTAPPGTFSSEELLAALTTHVPDEDVRLVLGEGMRRLSAMLPDKKLTVHAEGQLLTMEIAEKDPSAGPVIVSFTPRFPDTAEGAARRRAFEEFLMYGTPVEFLSGDIPFEELPADIRAIVANQPEFRLRLGPSRGSRPMLVRLRFEAESGEAYEVPYLDLRVSKGGSQRVVATNAVQPIPLKFEITFEASGVANIQWTFERTSPPTVFWMREFLRFSRVLRSPAKVIITALDDGIESYATITASDQIDTLDDAVLQLLDRLMAIQQKTGAALRLPERPSLDEADVSAIAWFEHVLATGMKPDPPTDFVMTVYDTADAELIERMKAYPLHIRVPRQSERLLDNDVNLGPAVVTCPRVDIVAVETKSVGGREAVDYRVVPLDGHTLRVEYERYARHLLENGAQLSTADKLDVGATKSG